MVSGGSVGTITALAAARTARLGGRPQADAVVYLSDQAHASNVRALDLLGFAPEQLRRLPADGGFRLAPAALREAVRADLAAGRHPFCVVATAGTTSSGAVDPLVELADLCAEHGLWLHVDGAYGAAAALCPAGRAALRGIERADSLVLDPHKWLFQPYELGCVLVREPGLLERTFSLDGAYLRDVERRRGQLPRPLAAADARRARAEAVAVDARVRPCGVPRRRRARDRAGRARRGAARRAARLGGGHARPARDRLLPPRR